jgi:ribonuclease HI
MVKTTINLFSDSKNCINGLTKLYKTWIKNQNQGKWIKSNGEEVENQDIYESILEIKNNFLKVNFIHINSHIGIEGNEEADKLAKEAVSSLYEKIKKRNSNAKTKI